VAVWGNTYNSYLDPLIKLQKRAVRLISGAEKLSHTAPIFQKLKILNIHKLYIYSVQLFLYKHHDQSLPIIFDAFFTRNNSVHNHNTRQNLLFHVPISRLLQVSRSIRHTYVKVYNHFSACLDLNCTFITYKKHLKSYLLNNDVSSLI